MRWIILTPLFLLLSACIYTEGVFVTEPKDVVVPTEAYLLTPLFPCNTSDITKSKQTKSCSNQLPKMLRQK